MKCDRCPVLACCSKLCSERENEIFKEYAINGKIEIGVSFLTNETMHYLLRTLKSFTPGGEFHTLIRESKNALYVEDISPAGRLKKIEREKQNKC